MRHHRLPRRSKKGTMIEHRLPPVQASGIPWPVLNEKRKCGTCTVCCSIEAIPELAKPAGVTCLHVISQPRCGCSIYKDRPKTCKGYHCAWQLSYFTDDDRPDKVGVMFSLKYGTNLSDQLLVADEVYAGAFETTRAKLLIEAESRRQLIYLRPFNNGQRRLLGPASELRRVSPIVQEAALSALAKQNG